MDKKTLLDDLQSKINQIIENTPIKDVEKNIRALITQALTRLDVVTREEFDIQAAKIAELEAKIKRLEEKLEK